MTTTQTTTTAAPQRRSVVLYLTSGALSIFGNSLAAIVLPVIVLTKTGQIGAAAWSARSPRCRSCWRRSAAA